MTGNEMDHRGKWRCREAKATMFGSYIHPDDIPPFYFLSIIYVYTGNGAVF
jgi:hypothetical protein